MKPGSRPFHLPSFILPPPPKGSERGRLRDLRGRFNRIHHGTGFRADIDLSGRDELNGWGIRHTVRIDFEGETGSFAPPESVIIGKPLFFRQGRSGKPLRDIDRMLIGPGESRDRSTPDTWVRALHQESGWDRVAKPGE